MQKNQVSIQAVGDKSAMKSLQGREAELKAKLASKNIQMASLQAFDARTVSTKRKVA
jgi:Tfp pilus assembly protein PilO